MDIFDIAMANALNKGGSGGGSGLPVVELTTLLKAGNSFTSEENALLSAAWETGIPVLIKCNLDLGAGWVFTNFCAVAMRGITSGDTALAIFGLSIGSSVAQIYSIMANGKPTTWGANVQTV